jgi:hypothetical protein
MRSLKPLQPILHWFCAALCIALSTAVFPQEMPPPTLIALLANPEKFDGKEITVLGYLLIDRQKKHIPEASLFLHEEDANNLLPNSVKVLPSEQMLRDEEKINGMYVMLTGVAHSKGVIIINNVRSCKAWSDPRRPILLSGEPPTPNRK